MYEDLQNVLESILEDENEVNKFLEMETMDELYEYFKNKVPNLSVEEFDSFIFDLLEEYAKSAQAVQNLDSSSLSKVAGGAGAKSKIAAITMSLLSLFPMAPVGSAHVDTESNIVSAQSIKTDKQGYFDKVKAILLSKFNSAKQTVSNKYKDAKEFVADKYAKTKKWVIDNPKLSTGIAFSAVVFLAAVTYGIHRYRHSGQQQPNQQPEPRQQQEEPPLFPDDRGLDLFFGEEADREYQPAAPHQVDQEPVAPNQGVPIPGANQGPGVRARANSDPQLPHQENTGRPRSGSDLRRPIGPHLPLRPPAEPLPQPQPQPQPMQAVLEEAPPVPAVQRASVDSPMFEAERVVASTPPFQTPRAASSGSQTVRSNVPLPTGEEETVMDRLARDALAAQRQQAERAVQAAYDASPQGRYDQLKHQPLQLKYTDEWHRQSHQTERGGAPATTTEYPRFLRVDTTKRTDGPVSSLNNRPMGSPTADSPLLRPADTSPVPIPKTPSVPHSMPTLGDSAREERSVPQTPVQQTPVQSAQAQLDSAQPTTPARPSPARAAYVPQYTTTKNVGSKIQEAIRHLEEDRLTREAQHEEQERSAAPESAVSFRAASPRTDFPAPAPHTDSPAPAPHTDSPAPAPSADSAAPAPAAGRTASEAIPGETRQLVGRLGGTRPKGRPGRRHPTSRHASAPITPDAAAAVAPQTPVAPRIANPQADSSKPTSPATAVTPAPSSPAKHPVVSSESPQNKGKNKQRQRKQQQQKGGKKKDLTTPGTGFSINEPTFQPQK